MRNGMNPFWDSLRKETIGDGFIGVIPSFAEYQQVLWFFSTLQGSHMYGPGSNILFVAGKSWGSVVKLLCSPPSSQS